MQPISPQHPLITQLAQLLGSSVAGYFTKPTVQSPIPQKQFPTMFQKNMQNVGNALLPTTTYSQKKQENAPITPFPTMMPGQRQWENANPQLQSMPPQQRGELYKKGVDSPGGHPYGQPTPTTQPIQMPRQTLGTETQQQLDPLEQSTMHVFQQNGIHPAVAYGIAQAEGGKIGSHNIWNINATDANPTGAYNYGSPADAAHGASGTIKALLQKSGYTGNDPREQVLALEKAGYAGDPRTWKQRSASQGGAGKHFNHWSDFVFSTDKFNKWSGGNN